MKTTVITRTALFCLLLGVALAAPCQPPQQGEKEENPQKLQNPKEQAKPEQQRTLQRQESNPATHWAQQVQQKQTTRNQQQQQPQQIDRAQQGRTNQRQSAPNNSQQQPAASRNQQADKSNPRAQQPQQSGKFSSPPARVQPQPRPDKNDRARQLPQNGHSQEEQRRAQRGDWQEHRAQHWLLDHRTWNQRGGYRGYRIPNDRFVRFFGPRHGFRIFSFPTLIVGGYPRFLYGGYWFSLVDPWPEYWPDNWYETDYVYIVYGGDGYYLFNSRYPGVGIAISISM